MKAVFAQYTTFGSPKGDMVETGPELIVEDLYIENTSSYLRNDKYLYWDDEMCLDIEEDNKYCELIITKEKKEIVLLNKKSSTETKYTYNPNISEEEDEICFLNSHNIMLKEETIDKNNNKICYIEIETFNEYIDLNVIKKKCGIDKNHILTEKELKEFRSIEFNYNDILYDINKEYCFHYEDSNNSGLPLEIFRKRIEKYEKRMLEVLNLNDKSKLTITKAISFFNEGLEEKLKAIAIKKAIMDLDDVYYDEDTYDFDNDYDDDDYDFRDACHDGHLGKYKSSYLVVILENEEMEKKYYELVENYKNMREYLEQFK